MVCRRYPSLGRARCRGRDRTEEIVVAPILRSFRPFAFAAAATLVVTGCSRKQADTYQGYIEGRFVYVACPRAAGWTVFRSRAAKPLRLGHPLFEFDNEPEADEVTQAGTSVANFSVAAGRSAKGKTSCRSRCYPAQSMQALAEKKRPPNPASDQAQYRAGGIRKPT